MGKQKAYYKCGLGITIIVIFAMCLTIRFNTYKLYATEYQFIFHHYNDVASYSQTFFLPSNEANKFFYGVNASSDANKNMTLSKLNDNNFLTLNFGGNPIKWLKINVREKLANNKIVSEESTSKIKKNEFLLKTTYVPIRWLEISPYYQSLSEQYIREDNGNIKIYNPGNEIGVKGRLNIGNVGDVSSGIKAINQSINNLKSAILNASFHKSISTVSLGGTFTGKNEVSHYPVLNGKEEEYLEFTSGNLYSEFPITKSLNVSLIYEGEYRNEIYTLLEGYGEKHNNENNLTHNISAFLNYQVGSKVIIDAQIGQYRRKQIYQDGLNNEFSLVKTFIPSISFYPTKHSQIRLKRTLKLSSFSFPNPLTVTDRDLLDKSVLLSMAYTLPCGTYLSIDIGRTEDHIIYIRKEMSANNVNRIKYNLGTLITYVLPGRIKFSESFSLDANYQLYDFSSDKNLFSRSFNCKSQIALLNNSLFQPSMEYELLKQDWGPYLISYSLDRFLYYRDVQNKRQSFDISLLVKLLDFFNITPSLKIISNKISGANYSSDNTINYEGHYTIAMEYNRQTGKFVGLEFSWVKRKGRNDFYELKSEVTYGI